MIRYQFQGPFVVRGVLYHDFEQIAAALNVKYASVVRAYRLGAMQTIGRINARDDGLLPFMVRSMKFDTFKSCAEHFGLVVKHVKLMVRSGRAEYIGLPPHQVRTRSGPIPMPIAVRGVVYKDRAAAAEALGVTARAISNMVSAGRADFIGLGRDRTHARKLHAKPVEIGPLKFPSRKAAAAAIGCNVQVLSKVLDLPPEQRTEKRMRRIARLLAAYAAKQTNGERGLNGGNAA